MSVHVCQYQKTHFSGLMSHFTLLVGVFWLKLNRLVSKMGNEKSFLVCEADNKNEDTVAKDRFFALSTNHTNIKVTIRLASKQDLILQKYLSVEQGLSLTFII